LREDVGKPASDQSQLVLDVVGLASGRLRLKSAKIKRCEAALDRDNAHVDRILEDIPELKSLGKVRLEQLLEKWKADKEEIGGYEYNYSCEEIIIKADGGAVHQKTVQLMSCWFDNFAESNKNLDTSSGEGTLVHPHKSGVI
jgi:hypothetical protein